MNTQLLSRRSVLCMLPAVGLSACMSQLGANFTPGALDQDAKIYAFQFGATAESYAFTCATTASRRLVQATPDGVRFLEELARTKQQMHLDIQVRDYDMAMNSFDGTTLQPGTMAVQGLDVKAWYSKAGEKAPGQPEPGKQPVVSAGGFSIVNAPQGIDAGLVDSGQNAVFGVPFEMNGMNTPVALARKSAFERLVLKKRVEFGQKADYRIPDRPAEKTIADVDLTLALIAEAEAALNRRRASMILLMAIYASHARDGTVEQLRAASEKTSADVQVWLREHPLVTSMEGMKARANKYGVRGKPLLLPTPQNMLAMLDEHGYVAAAVKVAQGIASGSIADTVSGIADFAPKDSSAREAMEGVAAAARGDFAGCVDAVGKIGGHDPGLTGIRDDLEALGHAGRN